MGNDANDYSKETDAQKQLYSLLISGAFSPKELEHEIKKLKKERQENAQKFLRLGLNKVEFDDDSYLVSDYNEDVPEEESGLKELTKMGDRQYKLTIVYERVLTTMGKALHDLKNQK